MRCDFGRRALRRMTVRVSILAAAVALIAGCVSTPPPLQTTHISKLIDKIKIALSTIRAKVYEVDAPGASCATDNKVRVVSVPTSASVILKTVMTELASGSVTVAVPILPAIAGSTIGGGYAYTNTNIRTQTETIDVNIAGSKTYFANELKVVTADQKTYKDLLDKLKDLHTYHKVDDALYDAAKRAINNKKEGLKAGVDDLYIAFAKWLVGPPAKPARASLDDLKLAAAVEGAEKELLNVTHTQQPCVKPQTIKVQVDFEVQQKSEETPAFNLVVVKLAGDTYKQDAFTHSLIVTFDLTEGGTTLK